MITRMPLLSGPVLGVASSRLNATVTIQMNLITQPCTFFKSTLYCKGKELDRLMQERNIILPIELYDWAAQIVPILKVGIIRICEDHCMTASQALKINIYLLPRIDDLFASLAGGKFFSKLDLAKEYISTNPIIGEVSKKLVAIYYHTSAFGFLSVNPLLHQFSKNHGDTFERTSGRLSFARAPWSLFIFRS